MKQYVNLETIDMFKNKSIEIMPLTVLTGVNGSGKTTILKAIEDQFCNTKHYKWTGLSIFKEHFEGEKGDSLVNLQKVTNEIGESIDDLIAKYGSLSNAIKQASIDSLKDQQIDLIAGVDAAREELIKAGKDAFGSDSWKKSIVAMGEEAGKAWQVLEDAGIISSGTHTDVGGEWFLSGDASEQGVLKNYKTIEKALEALRDSNKFTQEELSQHDKCY